MLLSTKVYSNSQISFFKGGIEMEGILSVAVFIIPAIVLFLIIFYAVKFAIIEAHREINEREKQTVENKHSL